MEKPFICVIQGYEIHAGAQLLDDGRFGPTLQICRDHENSREEHSLSVPGPQAFLRPEDARDLAFEHGMHWVKENG